MKASDGASVFESLSAVQTDVGRSQHPR